MFGKVRSTVKTLSSSGRQSGYAGVGEAGDAPPAGPGDEASVEAELAAMWACLIRLWVLQSNGRLDKGGAHFARLYELTTAVCGAADADGRRNAADVACSLCLLLDRMGQPNKSTLAVIEEHIGMLESMFHHGCWQDDEWNTGELTGRLAELRIAACVATGAEPAHGRGGKESG